MALDLGLKRVGILVKLRSKSRLIEGQVKVRKVNARVESCELKDLNINLKTLT